MLIKVKLKYLRIAPRKVRLVAALIKNKRADKASVILEFTTKKAAEPLSKLLDSAIASSKNDFNLKESNLYISSILVDEGPKLKRWRARSRGRSAEIQKKTSHITLTLQGEEEKLGGKKRRVKKDKKEIVKSIESGKAKEEKNKEEDKNIQHKALKDKEKSKLSKPATEAGKGIRKIFRRKSF